MAKLLRILVILLLVLSIGALVLANMLFGKRELLKGRALKLENMVVALGTALEAEPAVVDKPEEYPARDVSPCKSEVLDNPELSDFWDRYSHALEVLDQPVLDNLRERRRELTQYYQLDPVTGSIMRDPTTGLQMTEGEGTMHAVLNEVLTKAQGQYNRLNETRQQLKGVRTELVTVIKEVNSRKKELRVALKNIDDLKAQIAPLKNEIRQLKEQAEELTQQKRDLEESVAEKERDLAIATEESAEKDAEISRLKKQIDDLMGATPERKDTSGPGGTVVPKAVVQPGLKGTVIAVNPEWNFAILELTDDFLREVMGEDLTGPVPNIELMIKRKEKPDRFVTKVRLIQVNTEQKIGIADILTNWQQIPVQEGDVVFN